MAKREMDDELLRRDSELKRRREQRKKKRQREMLLKAAGCVAVLAVIVGITRFTTNALGVKEEKTDKKTQTESAAVVQTETENKNVKILEEAQLLAAGV